jgi:hypothetical protein
MIEAQNNDGPVMWKKVVGLLSAERRRQRLVLQLFIFMFSS